MKPNAAFAIATIIAATSVARTPARFRAQPGTPIEQRVDALIARQMAMRRIPGLSLGVVRDGQLVLAKGFGDATLEWKQPATPDTVYLLASVTKTFTATAIVMLAADGKLALDDAIGKYVDAPPRWAAITIRHLLTHTGGLKDRFEAGPDRRMALDYSAAQMLAAASSTPVDAAPGAMWQYSDQGFFLLGLIVERASGQSYGSFLRQRILVPAGMASTTLHDWKAIVPERADGYAIAGDTLVGSRRRYQFAVVSHYGLQSTVRDLAKYDAALSSGALLPPAALAAMWVPATLADGRPGGFAGIGYGLGWFLEQFRGHREVYHGGTTGTCLYRLPDDKVSVIVLTNLEQESGSDPCGIARMVAAQYVPEIAIVTVPPIPDLHADRTKRLRAAIEAVAQGNPDAADYAQAAFPMITAAAAAQRAALTSLGPILSFDPIADDSLAETVVWYRAKYRDTTLHFRFAIDAAGKITSLQAR